MTVNISKVTDLTLIWWTSLGSRLTPPPPPPPLLSLLEADAVTSPTQD